VYTIDEGMRIGMGKVFLISYVEALSSSLIAVRVRRRWVIFPSRNGVEIGRNRGNLISTLRFLCTKEVEHSSLQVKFTKRVE